MYSSHVNTASARAQRKSVIDHVHKWKSARDERGLEGLFDLPQHMIPKISSRIILGMILDVHYIETLMCMASKFQLQHNHDRSKPYVPTEEFMLENFLKHAPMVVEQTTSRTWNNEPRGFNYKKGKDGRGTVHLTSTKKTQATARLHMEKKGVKVGWTILSVEDAKGGLHTSFDDIKKILRGACTTKITLTINFDTGITIDNEKVYRIKGGEIAAIDEIVGKCIRVVEDAVRSCDGSCEKLQGEMQKIRKDAKEASSPTAEQKQLCEIVDNNIMTRMNYLIALITVEKIRVKSGMLCKVFKRQRQRIDFAHSVILTTDDLRSSLYHRGLHDVYAYLYSMQDKLYAEHGFEMPAQQRRVPGLTQPPVPASPPPTPDDTGATKPPVAASPPLTRDDTGATKPPVPASPLPTPDDTDAKKPLAAPAKSKTKPVAKKTESAAKKPAAKPQTHSPTFSMACAFTL